MEEYREEVIDLRNYFMVIRKRWKIIALVMALTIVGAVVFILQKPQEYESLAMLRIGELNENPLETPETVMEVFKAKFVIEEIAKSLGYSHDPKSLEALSDRIKISKKEDLLEIKARGSTPQEAVDLVDAASNFVLSRQPERSFYGLAEERL